MWRSKKLLLVVLLAVLAIVGTTAGIAFADEGGDEGEGDATTRCERLLDRVCAIYEENTGVAIDPEQLRDAFAQALDEKMIERLESRLDDLVEQGKLTQGEADDYLEWWQARPDIPLPGILEQGLRFGCRIMGGRCLHSGAVVWIPKACR
jgi:hypothetical protein